MLEGDVGLRHEGCSGSENLGVFKSSNPEIFRGGLRRHFQVQNKHAKKSSIKNFGAPMTLPLKVLYVGLFPVF